MLAWEQVLHALKRHWGYDSFRSPQDTVVRCLLEKRDALIVLPTGFGKSLCFQLPAILGSGVTLVISPLISLMEDQIQDLRQRKLSAATLHSDIPRFQRQQILHSLSQNRLRLLYLSPETLLSQPVWEVLQDPSVQINGLILDEAHTLVHWGDSFRPDYRRLGSVRPALDKRFPIAAFTATADPYAQSVIQTVLQLQEPVEVKADPRRVNLSLNIKIAWTPAGRQRQMIEFVRSRSGSAGLVYVRTRDSAREVAKTLATAGLAGAIYHGGLGSEQRRQLEQEWLQGLQQFLVCTNAFGMGINKPDVRWVFHLQPPVSVTDYIQEVGRSGRDGNPAVALMLVSEPTGILDPTDRRQWDYFRTQRTHIQSQAEKLLKQLPDHGDYRSAIAQFGSEVRVTLALLHQAGCLTWSDPFRFQLTRRPQQLSVPIPKGIDPALLDPIVAMERLISTSGCRWLSLLRAFGLEGKDPCGTCDRCRHQNLAS